MTMTPEPYRPTNATEGAAFERRWCRHCVSDWEVHRADELGDYEDGCEILSYAKGGAQPVCWVMRNGMPWCTEFVEDKANPAPCLFTKEMFA